MTIDWAYFDEQDLFETFAAACLWFEIDPRQVDRRSPPGKVVVMAEKLERYRAMYFPVRTIGPVNPRRLLRSDPNVGVIARGQLLTIAEVLDERPAFLYPEIRAEVRKTTPVKKMDRPHKRAMDSHLILISSLLKELGIDADAPSSTKKVQTIVEKHGWALDLKPIREILDSFGTISHHRKPK